VIGPTSLYPGLTTPAKPSATGNLLPESQAKLKEFAGAMTSDSSAHFMVNGYTDNVGNAAANVRLSQKRANSVEASLVRMGIPADRVFQQPSLCTLCLDVGRKNAGAVFGFMNTASNAAAALSSVIFGYLVSYSGNYNTPFVPMGPCCVWVRSYGCKWTLLENWSKSALISILW
jgi:hypothetical protein